MEQGVKRTQRDYSLSFKLAVVDQIEKGELTYKQSLHAESVAQAFRQALRKRRRRQPLVHHSDRGIQYCSALYQSLHARNGVQCSMTDGYDCYQNALAERINGILKTELLLSSPENLEQARTMVDEAVQIYNTERPHMALKNKTPDAVHRAF